MRVRSETTPVHALVFSKKTNTNNHGGMRKVLFSLYGFELTDSRIDLVECVQSLLFYYWLNLPLCEQSCMPILIMHVSSQVSSFENSTPK